MKVGEESTLIKPVYADGRTVFTLLKNGSVAAELIAGAKAKAGKIGFDATASVERRRQARGRDDVHVHRSREGRRSSRTRCASTARSARWCATPSRASDPFGVKDWVLDHTIGEDVDAEDLPEPDSTYVSAEAFIKGEAKAIGNAIIADAGAKGLLQLRRRRAGLHVRHQDKGKVELNIKIDAEAGREPRARHVRPRGHGQGRVHRHGHARPGQRLPARRTSSVVGTAGYNGDLRDAGPRAQADRGADRADPGRPEGGQPQERGVRQSTDGSGQQVEFHGRHGPRRPRRRRPTRSTLFTGPTARPPPRRASSWRRIDRRGPADVPDLRHDRVEDRGRREGRPGRRASASRARRARDDRDLSGSWVREPARAGAERNCGAAA